MKVIFVSASGTDVGKTFISGMLLTGAEQLGYRCAYWKPIQTGLPDCDTATIRSITEDALNHYLPNVYAYGPALAPDQAAKLEGREQPKLLDLIQALASHKKLDCDLLVIEGAGGLHVPLNDAGDTWLDFLTLSQLPVLLVTDSQLGTLNHTGLSIEALQKRGLDLRAVVLNGPLNSLNQDSLQRDFSDLLFLNFPRLSLEGSPGDQRGKLKGTARQFWQQIVGCLETEPQSEQSRLLKYDREHCWHPFTQHKVSPPPTVIARARGPWLFTDQGEKIFDCISSWWTSSLGHSHPKLTKAMAHQHATLDHVQFAGTTHAPAATLSRELSRLTEHKLPRVFFTDNGSCAVEVALKMVIQSWQNKGIRHKRRFLSLEGGYHGDTFGAMSVGGSQGFHGAFAEYLFPGIRVKPATIHKSRFCPQGEADLKARCDELDRTFAEHADELAGVIIEPLAQGAAGMLLHNPRWLKHLEGLCKAHQIPLILDEVFTGLGRLGSMFAYQQVPIEADIVCIAKGLTGGSLPLAATLASEAIFSAFYHDERSKSLCHGHTFTANPVACATAVAALQVYQDENLLENCQKIEANLKAFSDEHQAFMDNPRVHGALLAWELPGTGFGDYFAPWMLSIPNLAIQHGLLLRPLGNTAYLVPPLTTSQQDLNVCLKKLSGLVQQLAEMSQTPVR